MTEPRPRVASRLYGDIAHIAMVSKVVPDNEWRRRERQNLETALKRSGGQIYGPNGAAELLGNQADDAAIALRALGIPAAGVNTQ